MPKKHTYLYCCFLHSLIPNFFCPLHSSIPNFIPVQSLTPIKYTNLASKMHLWMCLLSTSHAHESACVNAGWRRMNGIISPKRINLLLCTVSGYSSNCASLRPAPPLPDWLILKEPTRLFFINLLKRSWICWQNQYWNAYTFPNVLSIHDFRCVASQ